MRQLILASGSVYRRDMLERLGLPFQVVTAGVDESARAGEAGSELAARLGMAKALAVVASHPEALVIGSDQVAECRGRLLGKPGTAARAREQLGFCSGHVVVFHSAIAVACGNRLLHQVVPTHVRLNDLDDDRIRSYVERDKPFDCAGAMRSESLGIALAESISSDDPTALIGLPLIATVALLKQFGVDVFNPCP
ncbi:MAG: Maf family protein [Wenzhouxiangella sp.]